VHQRAVSHYEIERKIGEGGMGEIYLARDVRLDRTVALKFLPDHMSHDPKARERFIREAKAASKLSHPNILTIHEVGEDEDGNIFIAMAYVEGETLDQLIGRSELPVSKALHIATQLCEGLSRAHTSGVIHRDVKPQNILVDRQGRVTILDFGLAKVFDAQKLTQTGAMVGTMSYMSPEQARGQDIDHRSDIFSFGAVLYEMLTGHPPFDGDNPAAVLYGIMNEQPLPPSRINSSCPQGVELIVLTALAKNPENRYQSTEELLEDLQREEKLLSISQSDPKSLPPLHARPPSRKRNPWLYIAPTTIAFALVTAFLVFNPTRFSIVSDDTAHADRSSLAVMYFDSVHDPDGVDKTGQMITNLLITDLSESEQLSVVSRQRLFDILKQLGHASSASIDRTVASEVAEKAGASWILSGSILQIEPAIILVSSVADAVNGRILASQRVEGNPGESLINVVDRLGAAIREDLAISKSPHREANRPLTELTTGSQDAYRHYLEGYEYNQQLDFASAVNSFEQAIALDSTFAMGYYRLSRAYRHRMMFEEANRSAQSAARYADHATPLERLYIEAERRVADGQPERCADVLRELVSRYPDEKEALVLLADFHLVRQQGEPAAALYEKVVALDPSHKIAYNNMTYAYEFAGNYDKAIESINRYIALAPDEPNPYDTRGDLYAHNGRLDDAMESYRAALARKSDFMPSLCKLGHMHLFRREYALADSVYRVMLDSPLREQQSAGRYCLALIPIAQGRLTQAVEIVNRGIAADELDNADLFFAADKYFLRAELLTNLNRPTEALQDCRKGLELFNASGVNARFYPRSRYILALAGTGRWDEAADSVKTLWEAVRATDTTRTGICKYTDARLAAMKGDYNAAIQLLENVEIPANPFLAKFYLADACLHAGQLGEATSNFKSLLSRYDEFRAAAILNSVRSHYLLGRTFEQSGWNEEAILQYREFLEYWGEGDRTLTEISDARARLVRLQTQT
jgi:serine/threonine protein kinase/tetratricopeptide (TPR) repeat protein